MECFDADQILYEFMGSLRDDVHGNELASTWADWKRSYNTTEIQKAFGAPQIYWI